MRSSSRKPVGGRSPDGAGGMQTWVDGMAHIEVAHQSPGYVLVRVQGALATAPRGVRRGRFP
jgi:hypothetical protein